MVERHRAWLEAVETTEMTRSYKMVVLLGMLNADAFPGSLRIDDLVEASRRLASRSAHLKSEPLAGGDEPVAVRALLERNPLEAWTGGCGTGGVSYFSYRDGVFSTAFEVDPADRPMLQELTRELVEWRLAEYLSRIETRSGGSALVCAVKHSGGRPILFLPDRDEHPELPSGTTTVLANAEPYEAEFAKIAVNVLRRPGEPGSELPAVLRGWFGADAGLPGTAHAVALERGADGSWTLRPLVGRRGEFSSGGGTAGRRSRPCSVCPSPRRSGTPGSSYGRVTCSCS